MAIFFEGNGALKAHYVGMALASSVDALFMGLVNPKGLPPESSICTASQALISQWLEDAGTVIIINSSQWAQSEICRSVGLTPKWIWMCYVL